MDELGYKSFLWDLRIDEIRCNGFHESVLTNMKEGGKVLVGGENRLSTFANILYVIRRYIMLSAHKNQYQQLEK